MRKLYRIYLLSAVSVMWFGICASLPAATIFDNSVNDLTTRFVTGTAQVGDEIMLAGTDRYLTDFSFEYFAINTAHPTFFDGTTITAEVRFYQNTGPLFNGYSSPGPASFWDSGPFTLTVPTDRNTLVYDIAHADFPVGGLFLPASDMTWSVQFSGMSGADSVGVDLYSPPVVGAEVGDHGDYWDFSGPTLLTNTVPMDFAAKFEAVPEPSTMILSLCGGLGILTLACRLRRKA